MQFTSKEFAEAVGTSSDTSAYGVITFLEHKGAIKRVGERKNPTGKGKGSTLYETVPNALDLIVAAFEKVVT